MELVQVNQLYQEKASRECVVVLEGRESRKQTRLVLPEREAAVLALEAHGVNDRCSLYHVLTTCVAHLGGAFCNVVIRLDANSEAAAYLTITQGSDHKSLNVNTGEVLALALHGGLPIYLDRLVHASPIDEVAGDYPAAIDVPPAFESLLSELSDIDRIEPSDEGPETGFRPPPERRRDEG